MSQENVEQDALSDSLRCLRDRLAGRLGAAHAPTPRDFISSK